MSVLMRETAALATPSKDNSIITSRVQHVEQRNLTSGPWKDEGADFLHFHHESAVGTGESIISLARTNTDVRSALVEFTNAGFHLYMVKNEVTSAFVRYGHIPRLWQKVRDNEFLSNDDGLIYSVQTPQIEAETATLLVIFSSMAAQVYSPFLMRHFEQNFSTVSKYIPRNTAILRIADLGGVVGSFYLNTNALPANEDNIQNLIKKTAKSFNATNVLLYGGSKGGTAALFHAVKGGYRGIAVDPIVHEDVYLHDNDAHFTRGVFPETKQTKFLNLLGSRKRNAYPGISVIYSERSPQAKHVSSVLIENHPWMFSYYNTVNPQIKTHPDVSKNTIHIVTMLMNLGLMGIDIPNTLRTVV